VPKAAALRAVLDDPPTARVLASLHWRRFDVSPMDKHHEILDFYRGERMVGTVTLGFDRKPVILDVTDATRRSYAYGANVANDIRVLAVLATLFVLMTGVWPLWRIRNLDVLVIASLTLSVVLYNKGLLTRMVLVSYSALIYLAFRCVWSGLRSGGPAKPSVPLYDRVTRGWNPRQRLGILRLTAAALALITAMVGFTSPSVLDVGYAVMEGATQIVHGVLPYGHIPDVLHGDTYPLGSYLFYVPFAWHWPVRTVWGDADPTLAVAVAAALFVSVGVWRMTAGVGPNVERSSHSAQLARLRMAIAILAFPPLLVTVSTGTTDVVLAGMLVAVLLLWRRPAWCMSALSAAAWFKAAPVAIVPLLLARLHGRAARRALAALLLTSGVMTGGLIALGGLDAPLRMLKAIGFQFTRSSPHTLWGLIGSVPLQQLAQAATVTLLVGAAITIRRDPDLAADRRRIAAIAAAVLVGLQLSANYWTYMYLVWVLPLITLALLAESTSVRNHAYPGSYDSARG